ncbi:uncharacterized protein [Gorilla gorilla gorilla]|uniref:uncharacterized protein isoform X1 n=1 Tax=Gorilla gorilla gorilla TaxID=9595 RepID=UPI002445BB5E|nr:uncharacterized protein LOC129523724 isoform X1 [Gorilla gorilla gorilla]
MKNWLLLGSPFQKFWVPAPFVTSYNGLANTAKFGIHSLQNPTAPKNSLTCLLPLSSGRLQTTCFLSVPELRSDPSDSKSHVRYLPSEDLNFLLRHLIPTVLQLHSDPSDRKSHVRYLPSEDLYFVLGYLIPTVLQTERQQVQSPKDYKRMLLTIILVTKAAKLFLYLGTVFPDKPENSDKATSLGIRTEKARVMEISPALSQEKVSAPQTAPTEVAALPAACRC